jgi:translation elongation factor EF-G
VIHRLRRHHRRDDGDAARPAVGGEALDDEPHDRRLLGIDARGRSQVVKAQVPLAEMYKYSTTLRSMTQGRGMYEIEFSHYEEVPRETAQKIIDEANPEKDEAKK